MAKKSYKTLIPLSSKLGYKIGKIIKRRRRWNYEYCIKNTTNSKKCPKTNGVLFWLSILKL